jgi:hypothetical protein
VTGDRWASAAAVTYVTLFVAARLLTTKGPCGTVCFARTTDERVVAFYEDSGNRWRVGIAYLLFAVALAAFLWFLARLHAAVAEIDGPRTLARLVILGGGVYAALQAAGTAVYAAVATGPGLVTDEEHYRVDAAVVRAAGDVSWMLRSLGSVAAAVLAVGAALAIRRAGRRRLGALGVVLAALTFFFALQEGTLDRGVAITIGIQDVPFLLWVVVLAAIVLRSAAPPATGEKPESAQFMTLKP